MSSFFKRFIEPIKSLRGLKRPPVDGYTVYTFNKMHEVQEYLTENSRKLSILVISQTESDLFKVFQTEVANVSLGHPNHVSIGYIDIKNCSEAFLDAHRVVTLPTSLLLYDRKLVYKVCGLRMKELSLKSRLALHAVELNPCSS